MEDAGARTQSPDGARWQVTVADGGTLVTAAKLAGLREGLSVMSTEAPRPTSTPSPASTSHPTSTPSTASTSGTTARDVQTMADKHAQQGYAGVRVDETPDEEYTVAGVVKAAKAAKATTKDGTWPVESGTSEPTPDAKATK